MIRAILLWLILALPAAAQSLPDWEYTSINDFAGLLSNDDIRTLDQALIALHDQTGVEGTVVTLANRASHGGQSGLEPFATRLFNYWGVGDKRRNDGFMILILKDDRESRIELGAGYPKAYDSIAQYIMDTDMIPAFRDGDYSTGLRRGTLSVIELIAEPHATGFVPEPMRISSDTDEGTSTRASLILLGVFLAGFAAFIVYIVRAQPRRTKRPSLSGPYLDENGELRGYRGSPISGSSGSWSSGSWSSGHDSDSGGSGSSRSSSSSSSSGFGGGSSSGGGASGRW